jgi:oligogalacturonide lyase
MHRLALPLAFLSAAFAQLPKDWIDPDTGHRVIRLSVDDGTQSLYFNQNAYTADGKHLIVTTAGGGIATINLATREIKPLVPGPVSVLVAGHNSGDVYYTKRLPRARRLQVARETLPQPSTQPTSPPEPPAKWSSSLGAVPSHP